MFTWVGILRLLLGFANTVAKYVADKQLLDAGEAKQIVKSIKASMEAIDRAEKARNVALDKFDKSGGVPDEHDPNLRD